MIHAYQKTDKGTTYEEFLMSKVALSQNFGFEIQESDIHPSCKPHQKVGVKWCVLGGRRAIFEAFGLGKTRQQLEILRLILQREGGRGLIVAPLGVRQEFIREGLQIGIIVRFIRSIEECDGDGIYITNYETVRDGKLDPSLFTVTTLDEAKILSSFGGTKTFREFMRLFESVKYRFVATATPSPNEYIELLAYAAYLGIMDVSAAKTKFFKRDATKADVLTLHPHMAEKFWLWVHSWALFAQRPSDLGFSDEGYDLPEMDVIFHEVKMSDPTAMPSPESNGQGRLIRNSSLGVVDAAREKRDSLKERVECLASIVEGIIYGDRTRTAAGEKQDPRIQRLSAAVPVSNLPSPDGSAGRGSRPSHWRSKGFAVPDLQRSSSHRNPGDRDAGPAGIKEVCRSLQERPRNHG